MTRWLSSLALLLALAPALTAQDADRSVKDGGITVAGWKGRVDRRPLQQGKTINDSRFAAEGRGFRVSVGPAGIFYNPASTLTGDYEVMGTFKEHKMAAQHPHSYGIFIGGQGLESESETLMYCIVYGTGTYAIKTFRGATVDPRERHRAPRHPEGRRERGGHQHRRLAREGGPGELRREQSGGEDARQGRFRRR